MDISLHCLHGKCQFQKEKVEISSITEEEELLDEAKVDLEVECHKMILGRDK